MNKTIEKVKEIKEAVSRIQPTSNAISVEKKLIEPLIKRIILLASKELGEEKTSEHEKAFNKVYNSSHYIKYFKRNEIEEMKTLVDIILDDLESVNETSATSKLPQAKNQNQKINKTLSNNKVFIVHGHNEVMKQSVARVIEKLGLEAVILHEQADGGATIIEKFTTYSDVGFAIILLSADDIGYAIADGENKAKKRARQNVILEWGYFIGALGRKHVVALVEEEDFEMPSDISGIIQIPFDSGETWKLRVLKELKASGYQVDANNIF